jgi:nitroreductase
MELSEAIRGRRSIRRFKPDAVSREVLEKILQLAQWAPSAMNGQDWRFIVVRGPEKEKLMKISGSAFEDFRPILETNFKNKPQVIEASRIFMETLGGAPVVILAYGGKFPGGDEDLHSVSLAVQNILLAVHDAGLGAVWADAAVFHREKEINKLMGIEGRKLVCLIPVGYPDETPKAPPRRDGRVQWIGF